MMPAWNERYLGFKIATIHPDNPGKGLPSVHATYQLKDRHTGQDLVWMNGEVLTRLRTAAASALASSYLSRSDSSSLLMVGAGSLAIPLIEAHAAVRPIERVMVWNRSKDRIRALLRDSSRPIEIADTLATSIAEADIISCATLSTAPLVEYQWVSPGTHIDLVGAYRPDMRESDADLIAASRVFVDTYEGAHGEAGDLLLADNESDWSLSDIEADLETLCQREHGGRRDAEEITLFKSVGSSIEDLIAASLAWERHQSGQ